MFIKIGIGIVSYILMIYFIIFITVKMLNFLSESFVGISLNEACYRLVWGESITKKDYKKSLSPIKKEQKEMTKNEAINDLLEDSSHYRKTNYTSSFLTSDFTGIVSEENATVNESYTFYSYNPTKYEDEFYFHNPTKYDLLKIEDVNGEIYTYQSEEKAIQQKEKLESQGYTVKIYWDWVFENYKVKVIENPKLKQMIYHDEHSAIEMVKSIRKLGFKAEVKNGDVLGDFIVITDWE